MKVILRNPVIAFCSAVIFLTACQEDEQPQADVDIRDLYIGSYICEVTKKDFQKDMLFASYKDTIEIAKQGEDELLVLNTETIQLPAVKFLEVGRVHPLYVTIGTQVAFEDETIVEISHGPDSAFYELKGVKIALE